MAKTYRIVQRTDTPVIRPSYTEEQLDEAIAALDAIRKSSPSGSTFELYEISLDESQQTVTPISVSPFRESEGSTTRDPESLVRQSE